jgi:hypothetical protein
MTFTQAKTPNLRQHSNVPGEIIDINDTNAKVKIDNKIKVLNVIKFKIFLQEHKSETNPEPQDLTFNDYRSEKPITRAHAKLINYKKAAQLALLMLNEEGGDYSDILGKNIDSLSDGTCCSCDSENDYFKLNPLLHNFTQKCQNCDSYKKLFLKLKEHKEQCYQLRKQINFCATTSFIRNLIKLKVWTLN